MRYCIINSFVTYVYVFRCRLQRYIQFVISLSKEKIQIQFLKKYLCFSVHIKRPKATIILGDHLQFWISCEGSGFLQNCSLVIHLCIHINIVDVCVCVCVSTTYINYKTYVGVCCVLCFLCECVSKLVVNQNYNEFITCSSLYFHFISRFRFLTI